MLLFYLDFAGAQHCTAPCYHHSKKAGRPRWISAFSRPAARPFSPAPNTSGPLTVQRPFYPEEETCHLYLLHPPGGIVGGDELTISGAPCPRLPYADNHAWRQQVLPQQRRASASSPAVDPAPQATLEWLPQDAIFFPGANARLFTTFHLCASSRLLAWDLLCLGRPVIGETFSHGTLSNRLEVWVDDEPLLVERLQLQEGELSSVAERPWVGTLLCYPATDALLDGVRDALAPLGLYAGASLTDAC
ncbi:urease accessory protein UreD [Klebsiella pneumoniae]|uniref:Urease accessory protein UreD n=1 Tax=Klebsiella pneumoniae TaxID=573 RepID=A0A378A8B1_KLEPN|nr:urease accessory protein UreD [Klebsiella pneumoniae]